jgi:transcriptional regulator with XRE-family HTH domain
MRIRLDKILSLCPNGIRGELRVRKAWRREESFLGEKEGCMAHVGEVLRKRRLELGIKDVREISKVLKIRATYLSAIEDGQFDAVSSRVYLIGYLKSYGDFLSVDVSELINDERSANVDGVTLADLPQLGCPDSNPSKSIVILSIIVTIILYAFWYYADHREQRSYIFNESMASFFQNNHLNPDPDFIIYSSTDSE